MRGNARHLVPALLMAFGLASSPAIAQDIQNFRPAPGTAGGLTVESATVPKHLEFIPSVVMNFGKDPLVYRDGDGEVTEAIVDNLFTADILLTLGLAERLELSLDAPIHYSGGPGVENGAAFGDLRVIPKVRLVGLEDGTGAGLAISVPVAFPTGDPDKFVGGDQVIANPKLVLEARGAGVQFAANGGVRIRPEKKQVESLDLGTEVTYGALLGFFLGSEDLVLMAEVFGSAAITDIRADSRSNPLEGLLGLRIFTPPGAVITLGGGTGIIADYGSPIWRVIFGFAWHDRNYDKDGDGLLDDVDQCPEDPEDKDEFEDQDGCPDPDNDKDGILDVADACQLDPEDKDDFQDMDGCPEPDNDKDGLLDPDDKCPNEPENRNNWQDEDGCPDDIPDTDGDGLLDPDDKCPQNPEDKDGFQDEDGCPDPDNDADSILDVNDKCPMDPETVNGYEDGDGCPDERPTPTLVVVTKEKIEILQKVFFFTNKSTIKRESYPVLDQVAEVLVGNPNIGRVRVEGHTDSRGRDAYNMKLSQNRAESVRNYLIKKGVSPDRLDAQGFGEEVPIADNNTSEGRAENRRVEFTILAQ